MTYQTTNDFDLTRQDGTYTGATGELVVSDGGTITLPTPTAGEKFGVRALRNDVTLLSNGSIEASTSDRRIDSEGNSVFVSDGTEWYLVSGNEYFGFDIPDSGLLHQWPVDETSGSTISDSEGSNNIALNGPELVADLSYYQGAYADFVASNNDEAIADSKISSVSASSPFSLTFGVEIPNASSDGQLVVNQSNGTYRVSIGSQNGDIGGSVYDGSSFLVAKSYDGNNFSGRLLVTLTFDGSSSGNFYINESTSAPNSNNPPTDPDNSLRFGQKATGSAPFDGLIDFGLAYDRELSASEHTDIYDAWS